MFEDILEEPKRKGILVEPGVYDNLDCDGGCGKNQTFKRTRAITVKWKCAECCNRETDDYV